MAEYHWFLLALTGPFLYAATNHIDKQLLERFFKSGGVGTLLIVSSLFSLVALPITYFADPRVLDVDILNIVIMIFVGLLNVGVVWFYLRALAETDTSSVVIYYQLVPVLGLIFGFLLLRETINGAQGLGMVIIIFGTSIITFELDGDHRLLLRRRVVINMLLACLCWSLQAVIFKVVALEESVWRSLFWEHVAMFLVGLGLLGNRTYRSHFLVAMRKNSFPIIALNVVNEVIYLTGGLIASFAYMEKEAGLILLGNSFQPIFVLFIGVMIWVFFRRLAVDEMVRGRVFKELTALGITVLGTYILLSSTTS